MTTTGIRCATSAISAPLLVSCIASDMHGRARLLGSTSGRYHLLCAKLAML